MADTPIHEFCEVQINGQIYRDWTSVTVRMGVEQVIPQFRLQTIEPSDKELNERFLKIAPGHIVNIKVAGGSLITGGYVKSRQVSYDDTRHAVQIDGLAKAGPVMEASVDRKDVQFKDYKLEPLVNKLLEPLKIKFKLEGQPKHANLKFSNAMVFRGERIFEAVDRLCRARGIWVWGDGEGNLIGGNSQGGGGADLVEGDNILKASLFEEFPAYSGVQVQGQDQGNNQTYARGVSENSAKAEVQKGNRGTTLTELADMRVNKEEAQAHADFAVASIEASHMRVAVETQGWFIPGTTKFWQMNQEATVKSPMLFLKENETQRFKVWSATWAQSLGGTVCTVELVNEAAYGGGSMRSEKPTFSPGGKAAEPEPLP